MRERRKKLRLKRSVKSEREVLDIILPSIERIQHTRKGTNNIIQLNVIIYGRQGSGKTELCKKIASTIADKYGSENSQAVFSRNLKKLLDFNWTSGKKINILVAEDLTAQEPSKEELRNFFTIRHIMYKKTGLSNGLIITISTVHRYYSLDTSLRSNTDIIFFLSGATNPYDRNRITSFLDERISDRLIELDLEKRQNETVMGYGAYYVNDKEKGIMHFEPTSEFSSDLIEDNGKSEITGMAETKYSEPYRGEQIKIKNAVPFEECYHPPEYIENPDFSPKEVTLNYYPFLVFRWHIYYPVRDLDTNERLHDYDINEPGWTVIEAHSGKRLDEKHVLFDQIIDNLKTETLLVEEKEFNVEVEGSILDRKKYEFEIKRMVADDYFDDTVQEEDDDDEYDDDESIRYSYTTEPRHVKILSSHVVNFPVWNVEYVLGASKISYTRVISGLNGEPIEDDMAECAFCNSPTIVICTFCGSTICEEHNDLCITCNRILCVDCTIECIECQKVYCEEHKVGDYCKECDSFACEDCIDKCVVCKGSICPNHASYCDVCDKPICKEHIIQERFLLKLREFCSNKCKQEFQGDYRKKGRFGKFKKIYFNQ